jgi:Rieske Fe-S protein
MTIGSFDGREHADGGEFATRLRQLPDGGRVRGHGGLDAVPGHSLPDPAPERRAVPWKPAEIKANSGRIFKFGSQPGLLVKTPAGELRAFAATCTHLNCTVQYREEKQDIWCACHNGIYDLNGKNVSGPPPRPLEGYKVNLKGEQIVVTKGA